VLISDVAGYSPFYQECALKALCDGVSVLPMANILCPGV